MSFNLFSIWHQILSMASLFLRVDRGFWNCVIVLCFFQLCLLQKTTTLEYFNLLYTKQKGLASGQLCNTFVLIGFTFGQTFLSKNQSLSHDPFVFSSLDTMLANSYSVSHRLKVFAFCLHKKATYTLGKWPLSIILGHFDI